MIRQNAETAVFIKEEVKNQNKRQSHTGGNIDIAGAHPGHGKNEDLSTKGVFEIFLGSGPKFEIDKFRRNIENHNHNTSKYFAVIQHIDMIMQIGKNRRWR